MYGDPGAIRTLDTRLRRPLLYPTELQGQDKRPRDIIMERVMGIGPTRLAWKARALPLSYTRIFCYWSERQDLNLRPPAPKAGALPS